MDKPKTGLVLHSGGLDSTTVLAQALRQCDRVETVSFRYGQSHSREVDVAKALADLYRVHQTIIDVPNVFTGAGSTLMDGLPQPHLSYEELRASEGPSPTYVPYRNGTLLSLATALALTKDLYWVYFGAHADDAHNYAYPDCTPPFIEAMKNAIFVGSYEKVELLAPFMDSTKADIVRVGATLRVP
ncbi:hypothetical protein LCGC14_2716470, partial [marine sediment metagenome]